MGSVKDLVILKVPSDSPGLGNFVFSDRFSVFDYGEMPDKIDRKGQSLCMVSAYFFEELSKYEINNHYVGLISNEKIKRFDEIEEPTNVMQVKLVRVVRPKKLNRYDYSIFKQIKTNFLLPLEVIYRNSVPEGSSLLRRIERGEVRPEDFGLKGIKPNQKLEKPIVDFSTKLEDVDRYLSYQEAKEIAGLSDEEFEKLKAITLKINEILSSKVKKIGLENEDGKIEFAFDEKRELMVVDSVGTLDECRFSFEGIEVSKEILRKYYRNTEWYKKIQKYKGVENWREIAGVPPKLPSEFKKIVSEMYQAFCNDVTGKRFFDVPKLKDVVKSLGEWLQ